VLADRFEDRVVLAGPLVAQPGSAVGATDAGSGKIVHRFFGSLVGRLSLDSGTFETQLVACAIGQWPPWAEQMRSD
jgi:hypothetical protein